MARNEKFNREPKEELITKTVSVNRITKVNKGGRKMHFAALVVCGDGKNRVGIGQGKANEVAQAIDKAIKAAEKNMVAFSMVNDTIPHAIHGVYGRAKVMLLPAAEGTGVIAGGAVRAMLEVTGIKNIRTKCIGTNNPINCVKATLNGLTNLRTAEEIAKVRGIPVENL